MAACSKHHGQPYVMVCHSCDKRYQMVCCECIAKEHKGHDLKTFETAANNVLDRLRKEKANISPTLKEIRVDLKNYATIEENEKKISENTRQYIIRRRDLLKLAVDEAAEILLEKQESSDKRIMNALRCGKQEAENKVRNFLEFQSKLASLELSTDYQQVIKCGKQMYFPNIPKSPCPIPAVIRHILTRKKNFDRRLIRELFGEELEEDIRSSYILHCFDEVEDSETDSVYTTDLFANDSGQVSGSFDSQGAEADGNVWPSGGPPQIDHPNVSQELEPLNTFARTRSPLQISHWNSTAHSSQYQTRYHVSSTQISQWEQGRHISTEKIHGNALSNVFEGRTSSIRDSIAPAEASESRLPPPNDNSATETKGIGFQMEYGGSRSTPRRRSDTTNYTRLHVFNEVSLYPRKDGFV